MMAAGQLPRRFAGRPFRGALLAVAIASVGLAGQQTGLDPARILKPLSEDWPSYSGDYTAVSYTHLTLPTKA